jgi:hypothetical protein
MKKNVIVLTAGISGSSVLTGLIARAGYSVGDSTYKKPDYDTHENERLVELNKQLIAAAEYHGDYTLEFAPDAIERIAALHGKIDDAPYREFLKESREPWIWKDPRLWLTIRFWKHVLDLNRCSLVLLTRSSFQTWISANLRRQVQTYGYLKRYNDGINTSIANFVAEERLPHHTISYEALIMRPEPTIAALNDFLGTSLGVDDLSKIYTKPLRKDPRSWKDYATAGLIYVKNYGSRLR